MQGTDYNNYGVFTDPVELILTSALTFGAPGRQIVGTAVRLKLTP